MRILKHIVFLRIEDPELWSYCQEQHIPLEQPPGSDLITLDIHTDHEHWPWVEKYMAAHPTFCLSSTEFSKKELQDAPWLRVRSAWRTGYPEPTDDYGYEKITYDYESACPHCMAGLKQVLPFRTKKIPTWGRRHAFSLWWVEDELFVNDTAKAIFEKSQISGIDFWPVLDKLGRKEHSGVHQLYISHYIPPALIENKLYLKNITICPHCGTKKFCGNGIGRMQYKAECFTNLPDIIKTSDIFGGMPKIAVHEILINQKVYQLLTENHLDRSLIFEPIDLSEQ